MRRSRQLVRLAAVAAVVSGGVLIPQAVSGSAQSSLGYVSDPVSAVNPLIGTSNGDDMFPGAGVPLGMIQWSPDTRSRPDGGGYEYDSSSIIGYSLTHLSGPGCPAEGDVPILPTTGAIGTTPSSTTEPLDHRMETATPGYYQLDAGGINTQLSTATRSGIAKITFPSSASDGNLLFKLSGSETPDTATHFQVVSDKQVAGWVTSGYFCGAANQYTLHFDMVFDRPFSAYGMWTNGSSPQARKAAVTTRLSSAAKAAAVAQAKAQAKKALAAAGLLGPASSAVGRIRSADTMAPQPPVSGADGAYLTFDTGSNHVVMAKVGISYVSTDNATLNRMREIAGWNLSRAKAAAHRAWYRALSKLQIAGGTAARETTFYTALYHSLLHPNVESDINGLYMGFDGQLHTVQPGHAEYANYSGWDVYRSGVQLEAMLFPKRVSDIVNSMLDDYDQTGMLPKWNEDNGEAYIMVGDPSDPIIADAYAFGARRFDAGRALSDMQTEANVPGNIRPGLSYYESIGYLPIDHTYGCCNYYGPVSTQEEYNAADNSIAEMATAMGKRGVARTFEARINNWQNVFNPGSRFLQPKQLNGAFQPGFNPTSGNGFVEADAYIYTAELPFDLEGLVKAEGGDANWTTFLNGVTSSVTAIGPTEIQMGNEPASTFRGSTTTPALPLRPRRSFERFSTSCTRPRQEAWPATTTLAR